MSEEMEQIAILHKKQSSLETFCKTIERQVEDCSKHVGEGVDNANRDRITLLAEMALISGKLDKAVSSLAGDISVLSDKVDTNCSKVGEFIAKMSHQMDRFVEVANTTQNEWVSSIEEVSRNVISKISFIEFKQQEFMDSLNKAQMKHIQRNEDTMKAHSRSIDKDWTKYNRDSEKKMTRVRSEYIRMNNEIDKEIKGMNRDISTLLNLESTMINISETCKEKTLNSVNDRMNNFREDVEDRLKLQNGNGEPKDVLKRLAVMEGIKEAIDHRKSAKEVLRQLEDMKTELNQSERKGVDCSVAQAKVDALMWVLDQ